jgi:hypothetical protein
MRAGYATNTVMSNHKQRDTERFSQIDLQVGKFVESSEQSIWVAGNNQLFTTWGKNTSP